MARKLKGKNVARLKKDTKKKMEKTLKRMDKIREKDSIRLRTAIESKIKLHQTDIIKADDFIDTSSKKIESIKVMKLKLEGAVISLQEILNNATKTESND